MYNRSCALWSDFCRWSDVTRQPFLSLFWMTALGACVLGLPPGVSISALQADEPPAFAARPGRAVQELVREFCLDCHSGAEPSAGLDLESLSSAPTKRNVEVWEKIVRKLQSRQMPPGDAPRPKDSTYDAALTSLEQSLDKIAAKNPRPGRTETFRRLTRTEYQNSIRDLLALEIDARALLPKDESSQGFDNVTVGELSPTLLNRYISAAQKISRLAVGRSGKTPPGETIRIRPDITQEDHVPGLPIGTRGGALIRYNFPQDGDYEIRIRLARDRNEHVEGLHGQHELEVLLDRERVGLFTVKPPPGGNKDDSSEEYSNKDYSKVDAHLATRVRVKAGPHRLGVTFLKKSASLLETKRQPYQAHFNMHRHPRIGPAVYQVSITGPYEATGPGDTPSRRRIFICEPKSRGAEEPNRRDEEDCAKKILANLARRAWRRPLGDEDLRGPLKFFRQGRAEGDFDAGIELALASVLVNPQFLFRIERDPADAPSGAAYAISDLELASRLSFFLWSSIPDDKLLDLATRGELRRAEVLQQQVGRMLADPRSRSLVTNFAGQWLHLRNLDSAKPDMRLFPDFDDNLRQAMRVETELFFESIAREDRSVLDLLRADYTYLNERLARHYGIPHVHGGRFRRVALDKASRRGGLLRHGSLLTVTSYATRTSPVIRGQWILKNLLGSPAPPPPESVPAIKDNTVSASLPLRERLAQHRADENCARCHNLMDPVGLSLENFDAIGRWRDLEAGIKVDASGSLLDGAKFTGVEGLEDALLKRPELFVATLSEKLLTYALGRGVDYHDAPAIRRIVRDARADNYRFRALVMGIVKSPSFLMRTAE